MTDEEREKICKRNEAYYNDRYGLEEEVKKWLEENTDDSGYYNPIDLAKYIVWWYKCKMKEDSISGHITTDKYGSRIIQAYPNDWTIEDLPDGYDVDIFLFDYKHDDWI